jgi:tRNA G37 N-methylase Trm5
MGRAEAGPRVRVVLGSRLHRISLLGHGLCETLCLADINPQAVEACRRTIEDNRLGARVAVYHSDNLAGIPARRIGPASWKGAKAADSA